MNWYKINKHNNNKQYINDKCPFCNKAWTAPIFHIMNNCKVINNKCGRLDDINSSNYFNDIIIYIKKGIFNIMLTFMNLYQLTIADPWAWPMA